MITKNYINSLFNSTTYRIANAILDPGDEWEGFNNVRAVLLTHAHFDHIYGLNRLLEINPMAIVYTNEHGREMLLNDKLNMSRYHETPFEIQYPERIIVINNGAKIRLGDDSIAKAIFTPGHNPSCITWVIDDCVFTGDAYIPGIKTVTNLPGGNKNQAAESIEIIKKISNGRRIFPGHKV